MPIAVNDRDIPTDRVFRDAWDISGGVIIEVGGKVYDGSVRTQLQGLKQNLERTF